MREKYKKKDILKYTQKQILKEIPNFILNFKKKKIKFFKRNSQINIDVFKTENNINNIDRILNILFWKRVDEAKTKENFIRLIYEKKKDVFFYDSFGIIDESKRFFINEKLKENSLKKNDCKTLLSY